MGPLEVLKELVEGAVRFERGAARAPESVGDRLVPVSSHEPKAVVVGCSDARVPVEIVFDQGVGDLFVVRTAGHVLEPASMESVVFGVRSLGARLVVVLGHEGCAAVGMAVSGAAGSEESPVRRGVSDRLVRAGVSIAACGADETAIPRGETGDEAIQAVRANVEVTVEEIRQALEGQQVDAAEDVLVVGAVYHVGTGRVEWLDLQALR